MLHDISVSIVSWKMTPKAQSTKAKSGNWNYINQNKKQTKKTPHTQKKQTRSHQCSEEETYGMVESICKLFNKGLIYKESLGLKVAKRK